MQGINIKCKKVVWLPGPTRFLVNLKNGQYQKWYLWNLPDVEQENLKIKKHLDEKIDASLSKFVQRIMPRIIRDIVNGSENEYVLTPTLAKSVCAKIKKRMKKDLSGFDSLRSGYYSDKRKYEYFLMSDYYSDALEYEDVSVSDFYDKPEYAFFLINYKDPNRKCEFLPYYRTFYAEDQKLRVAALHRFLMDNPTCIPVFLYTLLSLSEVIIKKCSDITCPFSLWLYSDKYSYARNAANLFSNLFMARPQSIYNEHKFHIDVSSTRPYCLYDYMHSFSDIPLIVYSHSSKLDSQSSNVNKIISHKAHDETECFPVFIASSTTRNQKVLQIKTDKVIIRDTYEFYEFKSAVDEIYYDFIGMMEVTLRKYSEDKYSMNLPLTNKHRILELDTKYCKHLIKKYHIGDAQKMLDTIGSPDNMNKALSKNLSNIRNLLKEFFSFTECDEQNILYDPQENLSSLNTDEAIRSARKYCNEIRHAISHQRRSAYITRLHFALELYTQLLKIDDPTFINFAVQTLEQIRYGKPINGTKNTENPVVNKDLRCFFEKLALLLEQHDDNSAVLIKEEVYRTAPGKQQPIFCVESKAIDRILSNHVYTPPRKFKQVLVDRGYMLKNGSRFVFQRTLNSQKRSFFYFKRPLPDPDLL